MEICQLLSEIFDKFSEDSEWCFTEIGQEFTSYNFSELSGRNNR